MSFMSSTSESHEVIEPESSEPFHIEASDHRAEFSSFQKECSSKRGSAEAIDEDSYKPKLKSARVSETEGEETRTTGTPETDRVCSSSDAGSDCDPASLPPSVGQKVTQHRPSELGDSSRRRADSSSDFEVIPAKPTVLETEPRDNAANQDGTPEVASSLDVNLDPPNADQGPAPGDAQQPDEREDNEHKPGQLLELFLGPFPKEDTGDSSHMEERDSSRPDADQKPAPEDAQQPDERETLEYKPGQLLELFLGPFAKEDTGGSSHIEEHGLDNWPLERPSSNSDAVVGQTLRASLEYAAAGPSTLISGLIEPRLDRHSSRKETGPKQQSSQLANAQLTPAARPKLQATSGASKPHPWLAPSSSSAPKRSDASAASSPPKNMDMGSLPAMMAGHKANFKEGQKSSTPPVSDPTRAFYESLLEERPTSWIAVKYCIENGVLPVDKHIEVYKTYEQLRESGVLGSRGQPKAATRPRKTPQPKERKQPEKKNKKREAQKRSRKSTSTSAASAGRRSPSAPRAKAGGGVRSKRKGVIRSSVKTSARAGPNPHQGQQQMRSASGSSGRRKQDSLDDYPSHQRVEPKRRRGASSARANMRDPASEDSQSGIPKQLQNTSVGAFESQCTPLSSSHRRGDITRTRAAPYGSADSIDDLIWSHRNGFPSSSRSPSCSGSPKTVRHDEPYDTRL